VSVELVDEETGFTLGYAVHVGYRNGRRLWLVTCPFCGGPMKRVRRGFDSYVYVCPRCGYRFERFLGDDGYWYAESLQLIEAFGVGDEAWCRERCAAYCYAAPRRSMERCVERCYAECMTTVGNEDCWEDYWEDEPDEWW